MAAESILDTVADTPATVEHLTVALVADVPQVAVGMLAASAADMLAVEAATQVAADTAVVVTGNSSRKILQKGTGFGSSLFFC